MTSTQTLGPGQVAEAAELLRRGGLVAFPTETVYGLGADASNDRAIAKVYEAKGRPVGHPLIVHIANVDQLRLWSTTTDPRVEALAREFWPGPLTLIVPRSERASLAATGGRETVGLRVPDHALSRELLVEFGGGVVGPSANRFGHVSPTTTAHVMADLDGRIDAVLDGGPCEVGIESTIVELVGDGPAVMLRPGGVTVAELETALGEVVLDGRSGESRAAGMLSSHYAPDAPVRVFPASRSEMLPGSESDRPGVTVISAGPCVLGEAAVIELGSDAASFGRGLYAALRSADAATPEQIVIVPPTSGSMLVAVLDRLAKASADR